MVVWLTVGAFLFVGTYFAGWMLSEMTCSKHLVDEKPNGLQTLSMIMVGIFGLMFVSWILATLFRIFIGLAQIIQRWL